MKIYVYIYIYIYIYFYVVPNSWTVYFIIYPKVCALPGLLQPYFSASDVLVNDHSLLLTFFTLRLYLNKYLVFVHLN